MKKATIALVALGFVAFAAQAQTSSANIVGYVKDSGAPGFHIANYAFTSSDTSPQGVFGSQLPLGTKIYTFDGSSYSISEYKSVFDFSTFTNVEQWEPNTLDLSGANGFWIQNSSGSAVESVMSGEVTTDAAVTNTISIGFNLLADPYPVTSNVSDLNLDPAIGDKVYTFDGSAYSVSEYKSVFDFTTFTNVEKWEPEIQVSVGQGFWYEATAGQQWIRVKPF